MKVAIYDVDSKIPNLALMKVSAYHRERGDDLSMYMPLFADDYDLVYASKIFDFSDGSLLDPERMIIGGTGWDMSIELATEIERMTPDYSLYGYPHNIGFTQRGCRLKCSFCVVPRKEGGPKPYSTIAEIWTQRDSDFVVLLDNDFFGNPEWPARIDEIIRHDLTVCFSQGLNIRNMRVEQADALASVKFANLKRTAKQVYFAWDDPRHEKLIHKGIERVTKAGIRPAQMAFFVLIGYHSTEAEDLHRVRTLAAYGCDPYAMPFDKEDPYQKRFTRWVNHKAIFKSVPWEDYGVGVRKKEKAPDEQMVMFGAQPG